MAKPRNTTSAKNWKKRIGGQEETLPSGNVALVKRPGMDKLLAANILPDSLTPIALENIEKAESGGRPKKKDKDAEDKAMMKKLFEDKNAMSDIFLAFDRVTVMCVVEPKVRLHLYTEDDEARGEIPEGRKVGDEIPINERDDELLYTDDVDQDDKMFIFQLVVGGTRDLETFRAQHGALVEAVESKS